MKRWVVWTSVVGMMSFAVGLAAQESSALSQASSQAAVQQEKDVTVTGCLQKGDKADTFMLTSLTGDTSWLPAPAPKAGSATGTAGTEKRIRVEAAADVKLAEHVGHRIEVTARFIPGKEAKGATGTTGTTGQASSDPRLNVKTVKLISTTCS